jgi:hypothetical protein
VNLLRTTSLAGALTAGAFAVHGAAWHRAKHALADFIGRLRVHPVVTFDEAGRPRFEFEPGLDAARTETVLADVFELLAGEARRRPAVLILDEFQAITRHGVKLPDVLKGLSDEHSKVSLVMAGSKRHLMDELVTRAQAPLFGMAEPLAVGPIVEEEMVDYLVHRAKAGGKPMDREVAVQLLSLAGPVPNDIQRLAYEAFDAGTAAVTTSDLEAGMARAVAHAAPLYAEALSRLSGGQARVLGELARAPASEPYAASFARAVGLANASSVHKALAPLLGEEDVVERGGTLHVADPFLAAWLRGEST